MRRSFSLLPIAAAAAALAACDGSTVAGPDAGVRFTDVQCVEAPCGPSATPSYDGYSRVRHWTEVGRHVQEATAISEANANVSHSTVSAVFYTYTGCTTGNKAEYSRKTASAAGLPAYVTVSDRITYSGSNGFQVVATHTFQTTNAGTVTFTSEASRCN